MKSKYVIKSTGETLELDDDMVTEAMESMSDETPKHKPLQTTDERIAERGTIQSNIGRMMQPGVVNKIMGGLSALGAPLSVIESGLANAALARQKSPSNYFLGAMKPEVAMEAFKGFTGQKQGRFSDVLRESKIPVVSNPYFAEPAGFAMGTLIPLKILQTVKRSIGSLSKVTDKGLLKAGNDLLAAVDNATSTAGSKVDVAWSSAKKIPIKGIRVKQKLGKLTEEMVEHIEDFLGKKIGEITNLEEVRKVKQAIGQLKTNWGKGAKGINETIQDKKLDKAYSAVKDFISRTLEGKVGKAAAEALTKADDVFTEVWRAGQHVKKTITDSTLLKATKAGKLARKALEYADDVTSRMALNTLKAQGGKSVKNINDAINAMDSFRKWEWVLKTGERAINAATFGGAFGGIGGYVAGKVLKREGE